jgi:flavodoxin
MKPLIIYQSETGNTMHVAESMAAATQADIKIASQVNPADLADRPLIGLGSGIYTMGHRPQILGVALRLPQDCKVFIFSTSGSAGWMPRPAYRFTHWRLRGVLRRRKIAILGEWDCPGQVRRGILALFGLFSGRPGEADLTDAARFAQQMVEMTKELGT